MSIFNKIFRKKNKEKQIASRENEPVKGISINISLDNEINVSSSPIGVNGGSKETDFYVYQWFIKDSGEIFYVGKGRGDRYKTYHKRAYEAEKIREMFDTDTRFVATGLTEEQAIELESKEITRILNEENDRLTNRIIPLFTTRDNGYGRSQKTPKLQFETTPYLYASEIEEHYFGIKYREFDQVSIENLKKVAFIDRNLTEEISIIYGGNLDKYLDETKTLLSMNNSGIIKTQFAKSVTAWIYIGDDYVTNYEIDQGKALERLGQNIPTYHLLDVRRFLSEKYGEIKATSKEEISINPIHNRVPLNEIRNLGNWEKGFREGQPYWEHGEKERKDGDLQIAVGLFDKARYNEYDAPALYRSYAMAYRKLKDYDNEIAIIDEAVERSKHKDNTTIRNLIERREKSISLKQKQTPQIK